MALQPFTFVKTDPNTVNNGSSAAQLMQAAANDAAKNIGIVGQDGAIHREGETGHHVPLIVSSSQDGATAIRRGAYLKVGSDGGGQTATFANDNSGDNIVARVRQGAATPAAGKKIIVDIIHIPAAEMPSDGW